MLPLDCIYQIALWTKFKTTIAIIGSCKYLFNLRKQFYLEKQLLINDKTINHWSPEENYYASTKDFTIFNINDYGVDINFYELSNSLLQFMTDKSYYMINKLCHQYVCLWDEHILKYYDTLNKIILEELYVSGKVKRGHFVNLSKSKPCFTIWKTDYYVNYGTIDVRYGLSYDETFKSHPNIFI